MKKTGFIGLGIMGSPIAQNLIRAGVELYVNDVNEKIGDDLAAMGAVKADQPTIGAECDVIFTILPNGAIVREVLFGKDGVAKKIKAGTVVCDLSSVTPAQSRECWERLGEQKVGFVDAPVSGGEPGAVQGTLAVMAGGNQKDFDVLKPYFNIMGSSARLIGGSGMGSVAKLANQIIVNLTIASVSEAFVFAVKAGADPVKVYEAIRHGLAGSAVLDAKIPKIVERNFRPGGTISINRKDIHNVMETAHAMDVPLPLTSQLFEIMQALKVAGHLNDDHGGIIRYFERLANVTVKKTEEAYEGKGDV